MITFLSVLAPVHIHMLVSIKISILTKLSGMILLNSVGSQTRNYRKCLQEKRVMEVGELKHKCPSCSVSVYPGVQLPEDASWSELLCNRCCDRIEAETEVKAIEEDERP